MTVKQTLLTELNLTPCAGLGWRLAQPDTVVAFRPPNRFAIATADALEADLLLEALRPLAGGTPVRLQRL